MKKEIRFKVKYGFKTSEQKSVNIGQLEKIIYGIQTDSMVTVGDRMIKAKNIVSIEPDYHYYTGWNSSYEPKNKEDFEQIKRDAPVFDGILEKVNHKVSDYINNNNLQAIGSGTSEDFLKLE